MIFDEEIKTQLLGVMKHAAKSDQECKRGVVESARDQ